MITFPNRRGRKLGGGTSVAVARLPLCRKVFNATPERDATKELPDSIRDRFLLFPVVSLLRPYEFLELVRTFTSKVEPSSALQNRFRNLIFLGINFYSSGINFYSSIHQELTSFQLSFTLPYKKINQFPYLVNFLSTFLRTLFL